MNIETEHTWIREYAEAVKAHAPEGVTVYLAESGTYGFFTNGKRVVSFGIGPGGIKLSGHYQPSQGSGSGWRISDDAPAPTEQRILESLSALAPRWANKTPVYTTLERYLATYQSSSNFTQI